MDANAIVSIFTAITGLILGGGFVQLLTVRAQRNRILGEGEVSQANAAKTYHEISMELLQEAREQAKGFKTDMAALQLELLKAQRRVNELNDLLDEKERIIRERDAELARLRK